MTFVMEFQIRGRVEVDHRMFKFVVITIGSQCYFAYAPLDPLVPCDHDEIVHKVAEKIELPIDALCCLGGGEMLIRDDGIKLRGRSLMYGEADPQILEPFHDQLSKAFQKKVF